MKISPSKIISLLFFIFSGFYLYTAHQIQVFTFDEDAAFEALESGHLSSLALDVFEHEPVDPTSPLLQHPNFHGTPHIGAATIEAQRRVGLDIVDAVLTVLNGDMAETTVNRSDLS